MSETKKLLNNGDLKSNIQCNVNAQIIKFSIFKISNIY